MTSNIGAHSITERKKVGFSTDGRDVMDITEIRSAVMRELKRAFRPEFLNRLDEIIVFHQLSREEIRKVAAGMVSLAAERVKALGVTLSIDDKALGVLADKGFDPVYGARPLRRVIQSAIEDAVAERILDGRIKTGSVVTATVKDGGLVLR